MTRQKLHLTLQHFYALVVLLFTSFVLGAPSPQGTATTSNVATSSSSSSYWLANIQRQGTVAFGSNSSYQIYRNVKDYGATGSSPVLH